MDVVERLTNKPEPCRRYSAEDDALRSEAAATITALRARVEELEGAATTHQRALEALEEAREALLVFAAFSDKAERFVEHKAKFGGTAIFPVKDFRLAHFRKAVEVVALIDSILPGDTP